LAPVTTELKHIRQHQYSNFQKCHQHQAFGLGSLSIEAINGTFGLGCNRTEAYKAASLLKFSKMPSASGFWPRVFKDRGNKWAFGLGY